MRLLDNARILQTDESDVPPGRRSSYPISGRYPTIMSDELTVLTTEHYTLQTARQACLQDMQGRATLFLYSVSAVLVALGFMSSASGSRQQFVVVSVTLLSALWVLGVLTFLRLGQLAVEDTIIVFGISRIRHR